MSGFDDTKKSNSDFDKQKPPLYRDGIYAALRQSQMRDPRWWPPGVPPDALRPAKLTLIGGVLPPKRRGHRDNRA